MKGPTGTAGFTGVVSAAGWLGTVLVLAAYFLSINGYVDAASTPYRLMNLFGALGICMLCWHKKTWQVFVLNTIWAAIAIYALIVSGAA